MTMASRCGNFPSDFRFRFSHASASRSSTSNIIVEVRGHDGVCGYGEGCPRDYVTGESPQTAAAFVGEYGQAFVNDCADLSAIERWIETHEAPISRNPSGFAALEQALLDVLARKAGQSIEEFLGISPGFAPAQYSAVLGDSSPIKTGLGATAYSVAGFSSFKIKLSSDIVRDQKKLSWLPRRAKIRVDANNLWDDADLFVAHFKRLGRDIWGIEEPVAAGDIAGMQVVGEKLEAAIILDESLINQRQLAQFSDLPGRWIANIRVSKCGGILRSISLAKAAQGLGMDVILGAHVGETSLLTRTALTVGNALERPPIAREGAFGTLFLKRDISAQSLRFGRNGVLRPDRYNLSDRHGLGVTVDADRVSWATSE
jgi:L-alanine-DL-glutamate epimerase-like enolase superfamily enzyme